jgi:hypothetical protein
MKGFQGSPDTGFGGHVKDQIDASEGTAEGLGIGDIPLDLFDPQAIQFRIAGTGETAHPFSAGHQHAHKGASEESSASGYEDGLP